MFFKSIRFRVMMFYMLLLAVTLTIFSAILYGGFNKILIENIDDLISSRAEGIANSIDAYWVSPENGKNIRIMPDENNLKNFKEIALGWVEEKRKDPELMSVYARILAPTKECIVAKKTMPTTPLLSDKDFNDIVKGEDSFDVVSWALPDGVKTKFRMYSKPVFADGKVEYIVQVAARLDLLSLAMESLLIMVLILLPLTVLLAGLPGVLLVGITLRPVGSMIKTLRQITAENLKLKIHIPNTKDELRALADTFNDMIDRLEKSFSSQQSFIQSMSAELKEPVTKLIESRKEALKKVRTTEEYRIALQSGIEELEKFSKIIDELYLLASFDNSQISFEIKRVNLTRLIGNVLSDMKKTAEDKDIVISSLLQKVITIDGDEGQLKQLFRNILDNAIKYTNRKGRITVAVHRDKTNASVTISDTGIGISEDELPYIFDRFYQVNRSRRSDGGFGLGLSIAKSVADAHKGTISVDSESQKGSTFTVTLPLSYPG